MKKYLALLFIVLSLLLASCGKEEITKENTDQTQEEINNEATEEIDEDLQIQEEEEEKAPTQEEIDKLQEELKQETENNNDQEKQKQMKQEREDYYSFSNISECNSLNYLAEECKDYFYNKTAISSLKVDFCEKISDEDTKTECNDEVNSKLAISNWNSETCKLITSIAVKNYCISETSKVKTEIAVKEKELDTFKEIASSETSTWDSCKQIKDLSLQEKCVQNKIFSDFDISICNTFYSTEAEKTKCINKNSYELNNKIFLEAFNTKSTEICVKAYWEQVKNDCFALEF